MAFGALGIPIIVAGQVTGIDAFKIGAMAGRQLPLLSLFVPFWLVFMMDGLRGVRETWPAALVAGLSCGNGVLAIASALNNPQAQYTLVDESFMAVQLLLKEAGLERPMRVVPLFETLADLSPDKSLARFCLRNGQQTFIVSWRNPTKAQREWGLSTYIEALKEAVDVVTAITGSKDINMLGACSGGITCTALLGHYAALGEKKVNALTLLVSVLDTTLDTQVALFVDEQTLEAAKRHSYQAGVLEGRDMAKVFAWMRRYAWSSRTFCPRPRPGSGTQNSRIRTSAMRAIP